LLLDLKNIHLSCWPSSSSSSPRGAGVSPSRLSWRQGVRRIGLRLLFGNWRTWRKVCSPRRSPNISQTLTFAVSLGGG